MNMLLGYFYDVFQLEELKLASMTIQLADRSIKFLRGILEDVLLKINYFIFPVDFIVLDMEGVNVKH